LNLPPIGEETFLICMALAILAGALLGFALGYGLKEKKHADEIKAIMRIVKPIFEKIERAPKGPAFLTQADWEREAAKLRRPVKWGAC
jgi:hypothetical protein